MRLLVFHPRNWVTECKAPRGVEIRHVSIGGKVPRRASGRISYDGIGEVATKEGLDELYQQFREWKPDVFLFGIHFGFEERHSKRLKQLCRDCKLVMMYSDQRHSISKWIKFHMDRLDMLLVTNQDADDHGMYKNHIPLVRTLYDGVSPDEYWPKPMKAERECFFGGNNFWQLHQDLQQRKVDIAPWIAKFSGAEFRDRFLKAVDAKFDLLIRGEVGWKEGAFRDVRKPLFHPNYIDALRCANIILNTINVPRYGLITRRFLRSIASGRLFMTEYVDGLHEHFQNHKHLVWFRTIEEGLDLIRYYLDHGNEREQIAVEGRKLVIERHTHQHRLDEFVALCRRVFKC